MEIHPLEAAIHSVTETELQQIERATATTLVDAGAVQQIGQVLLRNYGRLAAQE